MDRYEFKDGKSHKFWEVAVSGETLTVRFGKVGTSGQVKEKSFDSAAAAEKERTKLVKEKTGKGYVSAGTSAAPPPAPKAVSVAKPTFEPKTAAVEANDETNPAAIAAAETPARETAAPPSTPPPAVGPITTPALHTRLIVADAPLPARTRQEKAPSTAEAWNLFATTLTGMAERDPSPHSWPLHILTDAPRGNVAVATACSWINELNEACKAAHKGGFTATFVSSRDFLTLYGHFAHWFVATEGAVRAIEVIEALDTTGTRQVGAYAGSSWSRATPLAFRPAITAAPEPQYEAALAHSVARAAANPDMAAVLAFVLADDRPSTQHPLKALAVIEAAAANTTAVGRQAAFVPLIAEIAGDIAKPWREKAEYFLYFVYFMIPPGRISATAIAAARAQGESALPTLDWLLHFSQDESRTTIASAILDTHEDDALSCILPKLHEKPVRAALELAEKAYPDWVFQRLLVLLATGRNEPIVRARALKAIEIHGGDLARKWAAALGPRGERTFEALTNDANQQLAEPADLPSFLVSPPWRARKSKSADLVVPLPHKADPFVNAVEAKPLSALPAWDQPVEIGSSKDLVELIASAEERLQAQTWRRADPPSTPPPPATAAEDVILQWLSRRLDQIVANIRYANDNGYSRICRHAHRQPEALALMLWEKPELMHLGWLNNWDEKIGTMLSRFGERALPGLVGIVENDPAGMLPIIKDLPVPGFAPVAARALQKMKKAREPGRAWLRQNPRTALLRLVPDAVGPGGVAREEAEYAVRWLNGEKPEIARTVFEEYAGSDPRAREAIDEVLSRDPFARVPAKVSKLPSWLAVSSLTRPVLKTGGALSDEAMTALVEMITFINPDDVYPGVPAMREACTPGSIARFAWDLFGSWLANGAPSKEGWALRAVGWFGDDECARQLTKIVRKWPGEAAHARAVTGLDVLADIGSDVALMNLNGIAEKVKFKGLQERARQKIAAIAEARELSPEELADRLVPDLDLDDRGGLDLNFGPRRFRAGFDEFLKPWVKDETGKRLKDLPKPIKSDDAEAAKEASAKWAALKKDARAVASLQITRLETMLSTGRRTKPDVFHAFFAAHPLIRHLAQRLVWGLYDDDKTDTLPRISFRVAEDLSFTDAEDNPVEIDVGAQAHGLIGLAHPLHMSGEDQARWCTLFGDYEIAQPFPQLGRETFALTEAEKAMRTLTRFEGREVNSKRLRGMASKGWQLGSPQDGGGISWLERSVVLLDGTRVTAHLHFEEGLWAGAASEEPATQTLKDLALGGSYWRHQDGRMLGELDAVSASEIIRSIAALAEAGGS